MDFPDTVAELNEILRGRGYLADRGLTTALFVALSHLTTPLLYAIYKGHDVSFHVHLHRRHRRR